MKKFYLIFMLLMGTLSLSAQTDWTSWLSVQLNYKANDKLTIKLKPIVRLNQDLSNYSDTSIDLIANYQFHKNWSAGILNRHFFIPDQGDREFYFFDLNYKWPISEQLIFTNKLRFHLAVNWNRNDVDFMRYYPKLTYKMGNNVAPFVGIDFFYRLTETQTLSGVRYHLGANWKFAKQMNLGFLYWWQTQYNDYFPLGETHTILLNVAYSLN